MMLLITYVLVVPVNQQARYRGRDRCECYQNILCIYDFNMVFIFVWAGWEGISHDSKILVEVALNPYSSFPIPPPSMYSFNIQINMIIYILY